MKMKEKFQRLRALSKSSKGFTLVELIVVIAILAILAGVAVPAYNGYIKKAQSAADEQLISAVNTAFAAACLENGMSHIGLDEKTVVMPIDTETKKINFDGVKPDAIKASFKTYFAGNENSEFKFYSSLEYKENKGMFEGSETADYGLFKTFFASLADKTGVGGVLESALNNAKDSTFGEAGAEELMNQIANVTGIAKEMASETGTTASAALNGVLNSTEFAASASTALGISAGDLNDKVKELAKEMVAKNPDMTEADAIAQVKANAAVLYTAQQTSNKTTDELLKMFNETNATTVINNMTSGDGVTAATGMSQAALVCGMYTAYINSEAGANANKNVTVDTVLEALEGDANAAGTFKNYVNSEQGRKDLAGYLGSMQILSSSANGDNKDTVEDLMVNGFNDAGLINGVTDLIGK